MVFYHYLKSYYLFNITHSYLQICNCNNNNNIEAAKIKLKHICHIYRKCKYPESLNLRVMCLSQTVGIKLYLGGLIKSSLSIAS